MRSFSTKNLFARKVVLSTLAFLTLPFAVVYTSNAIDNQAPLAIEADARSYPKVNVMEIMSEPHQTTVQAYGEAGAQYELTLRAQVTGNLIYIDAALERGEQIETGQVMARIDPTPYQQQKSAAFLSLAEANLAYQLEQKEAERAEVEWERAGLEQKASPLVLREPQMIVAQARVDQSKATLNEAERDLAHTQIKAPFESIIMERHVAPGQYIQSGDKIATIYSLDRIDIPVSLPTKHWDLLPDANDLVGQSNIVLTDSDGNQWLGEITHIDRHIDGKTRQRSIIVSVFRTDEAEQYLLPGTFLSVSVPGVKLDGLFAIPASSLSSRGDIWFVTDSGKLSRFTADIVFQKQGTLYVRNPFRKMDEPNYTVMNILLTPNASYVAGQEVKPMYSHEVATR